MTFFWSCRGRVLNITAVIKGWGNISSLDIFGASGYYWGGQGIFGASSHEIERHHSLMVFLTTSLKQ